MSQKLPIKQGLYAITDARLMPPERFAQMAEDALRGGAVMLQYRDKSGDREKRLVQTLSLKELCGYYKVPLIINDDVELAKRVGADGVHLGRGDATCAGARQLLGNSAIIGISCYNSLSEALVAGKADADYVAFGRFFTSRTKPEAGGADLHLLRQARQRVKLPLVAIGGITPANAKPLITCGVTMLAAVHGVFGQAGVYAAAQAYTALFNQQ